MNHREKASTLAAAAAAERVVTAGRSDGWPALMRRPHHLLGSLVFLQLVSLKGLMDSIKAEKLCIFFFFLSYLLIAAVKMKHYSLCIFPTVVK